MLVTNHKCKEITYHGPCGLKLQLRKAYTPEFDVAVWKYVCPTHGFVDNTSQIIKKKLEEYGVEF